MLLIYLKFIKNKMFFLKYIIVTKELSTQFKNFIKKQMGSKESSRRESVKINATIKMLIWGMLMPQNVKEY